MATSMFGGLHDAAPPAGALEGDLYSAVTSSPDESLGSFYYQANSALPSTVSSEYYPASRTDPRSSTAPNYEDLAKRLTDATLNEDSLSNSLYYSTLNAQDGEQEVSAAVDDALNTLDTHFGLDDDEDFEHHVGRVDNAWDGPELENDDDDGSHDIEDDASDTPQRVSDEKEEQEFSSDETGGAHYEFRPAPRERDIQFSGAYIDQDDSGNYDPNQKSRPAPFRPRRQIAADRHDDSDQETERQSRPTMSRAKARMEGASFEVTLKLKSVEGMSLMRDLRSIKPDNWPEEPWNFFVGNPLEQEAAELDSRSQYLLRSDIAKLRETAKVEQHEVYQHRQGIDYTGHPHGRGCKACHVLGQDCSLIHPLGEYPCITCVEDNCECELLIEPKIKRGCNSCGRDKCSYLDGGDHSKPCLQCQHSGYACIAGPAVSLTRVRMMPDGSPAFTVEELKKISQKTSRRSKKRKAVVEALDSASVDRLKGSRNRFSNSNNSAPLRLQKKSRMDQIIKETRRHPNFYAPQVPQMMGIPAVKPRLYVPGKPQSNLGFNSKRFFSGGRPVFTKPARIPMSKAALEAQRIEALEARMTEPTVHKAPSFVVKTIQTKLAHPITFNAPTTAAKPCHFHTQSCMPLIGYGTTTARVHAWPSGAGYTEVPNGGGHTAQGCEPTRICSECTSARLAVCLCARHTIRAISREEESDENGRSDDDVNNFLDEILTASTEEEIRDVHGRCCSICPRVAHWTCVAEGSEEAAEGPEEAAESPSPGCGLRLCNVCNFTLTEMFEGNLQEMIEGMDSGEEFFPLGLRADAEFYKADGLLMRHLTKG